MTVSLIYSIGTLYPNRLPTVKQIIDSILKLILRIDLKLLNDA